MLLMETCPGSWQPQTQNCTYHTNTDERSMPEKVSGVLTDNSSERQEEAQSQVHPPEPMLTFKTAREIRGNPTIRTYWVREAGSWKGPRPPCS